MAGPSQGDPAGQLPNRNTARSRRPVVRRPCRAQPEGECGMTGEVPSALGASERARRAFLARVEDALASRAVPGLAWEYRGLSQSPLQGIPLTVLVATLDGVPGEARVAAVTAVRRTLSTRPGGDGQTPVTGIEPALEQIRATARRLGIAAVSGSYRAYEPFPGDGTPEYELTILEPHRPAAPTDHPAAAETDELLPVEWRHTDNPAAAAEVLEAWARAASRR